MPRMPRDDLYLCVDCKIDTEKISERYMVHMELWLTVMPSHDAGMLCIGCLEARLGRKLRQEDFFDAPMHKVELKSKRLMARLGLVKSAS